jgi:hypothetical protein
MGHPRTPNVIHAVTVVEYNRLNRPQLERNIAYSRYVACVDGERDESKKQTASRSLSVFNGCQSTLSHDPSARPRAESFNNASLKTPKNNID